MASASGGKSRLKHQTAHSPGNKTGKQIIIYVLILYRVNSIKNEANFHVVTRY